MLALYGSIVHPRCIMWFSGQFFLLSVLRSVKDWDQLNFTIFIMSCKHSYSKMKSNEVMLGSSTLMWLMTPLLAPPIKPQRTHLHFRGSTSVNMDHQGGELLGHGLAR